jgi:16S rRNA (cytosine1402-N4)-methyltransferase
MPSEQPTRHRPVMVEEVVEYLAVRDGGVYFDGTVGMGGHAEAILSASSPNGMVVGVDLDPEAVGAAQERCAAYGPRARIYHANYTEIADILKQAGVDRVDGVLLDLGVGSHQLGADDRGFSIDRGGPLDMRFDRSYGKTAREVVNRTGERELARIIFDYGEEKRARAVARAVVRARLKAEITDAERLAGIVARAIGPPGRWRIHPATRTFMALRIFVNDELSNLERFIDAAVSHLKPGGTVVIISFHSLEDRIVKTRFRTLSRAGEGDEPPLLSILTKKPLAPGPDEISQNPRARSAKLRAARRTEHG